MSDDQQKPLRPRSHDEIEQCLVFALRVDGRKRGVAETREETIVIAAKNTSARGSRYFTPDAYAAALASGAVEEIERTEAPDGTLQKVRVKATRYVESDTALVARVLGRSRAAARCPRVPGMNVSAARRLCRTEPLCNIPMQVRYANRYASSWESSISC